MAAQGALVAAQKRVTELKSSKLLVRKGRKGMHTVPRVERVELAGKSLVQSEVILIFHLTPTALCSLRPPLSVVFSRTPKNGTP